MVYIMIGMKQKNNSIELVNLRPGDYTLKIGFVRLFRDKYYKN